MLNFKFIFEWNNFNFTEPHKNGCIYVLICPGYIKKSFINGNLEHITLHNIPSYWKEWQTYEYFSLLQVISSHIRYIERKVVREKAKQGLVENKTEKPPYILFTYLGVTQVPIMHEMLYPPTRIPQCNPNNSQHWAINAA